jgi:hypothetical protein
MVGSSRQFSNFSAQWMRLKSILQQPALKPQAFYGKGITIQICSVMSEIILQPREKKPFDSASQTTAR